MNFQHFKCLLLLLAVLGAGSAARAQKKVVSGNVVNVQTKEPLQGVTVNIKGTSQTVVTDPKGFFSVTLPNRLKTITLDFSHIGYDSKEMKADPDEVLIVTMSVSNKVMDEVVVVGYGTQKRSDVLGSVSTVKAKDIEDMPTANLSTALINMVPGVGVSQTAGKPGASTTVSIRGATTFASGGSTSPLYVIDGLVPILSTGAGIDPTGQTAFNALDPSEIETITFLKDASATIYGARGDNGVVLVTTKRGKPGRPHLSYSGSYSAENASKIPKMIDGYNQALLLNNWVENYEPGKVVSTEIYTPAELDTIKAHNSSDAWFNNSWRPANIQRHTLNVSGGSDRITFFAGGNYYDENGNLPGVQNYKYGLQIGTNAKITDDLTVDLTVNLNTGYNNQPTPKGTTITDQNDEENALVGGLLSVPGWVPEYINGNPVYYSPLGFHPGALLSSGSYDKDNNNESAINLSINYKIPFIKGLSLRGQYGRNTYNDFSKQYYPSYNVNQYATDGVHTNFASAANKATGTQNVIYTDTVSSVFDVKNGNELEEIYSNSTNWQATEGVDYANTFGKHSIAVTLLSEQSQTLGTYLPTFIQTQVIPGIDQYYAFSSNTANWSVTGQNTSTGRVSYLGRLSYSYNDKYLLQAAFRDDASPNFPTSHQWGFFPSVSAGWKISEEKFFQENVKYVNDLKLRLNVGLTGNDATSAFSWAERYTASAPYGYLFGQTAANGLQTTVIPNPEITWEKALFKDLGLDGTFDNRKFNFTVDYWYKHQYDMLDAPTASVPVTFGGTIADENYGILNSWGTEFQLGYNTSLSRDWKIFSTVNFGWSNNKVVQEYYSPGTDTGYLDPIGKRTDLGISGYKATGIVRTQADVSSFYGKHPGYLINSDSLRPGDLNFQDLDGDGQITANDQTQIAKRSSSLFGMGFLLGASWKGLKLTTNISLSVGGKTAWKKVDITPPTKDVSGLAMWANSYTASNPNAKLPAIYAPFVNQTSSYWLHSLTSLYINNLQLSYPLPESWLSRYKIPEARIYITGMNLWNIINPTPYKDVRSNETTDYPILRSWTFGLNLNL
jgi:TonB-linked SusC/RagA family outer membrane protein